MESPEEIAERERNAAAAAAKKTADAAAAAKKTADAAAAAKKIAEAADRAKKVAEKLSAEKAAAEDALNPPKRRRVVDGSGVHRPFPVLNPQTVNCRVRANTSAPRGTPVEPVSVEDFTLAFMCAGDSFEYVPARGAVLSTDVPVFTDWSAIGSNAEERARARFVGVPASACAPGAGGRVSLVPVLVGGSCNVMHYGMNAITIGDRVTWTPPETFDDEPNQTIVSCVNRSKRVLRAGVRPAGEGEPSIGIALNSCVAGGHLHLLLGVTKPVVQEPAEFHLFD